MSHITVQATAPGQPMFSDLRALEAACKILGLNIEVRSKYKWYERYAGDYPLPPGTKIEELGNNAKFVLTLNEENRKKYCQGRTPYEIGVIEDPNNPGCYVPMYDFFNGGFGLDDVVGTPLFHDEEQTAVKMLCPLLKQRYEMCLDALSAASVGDRIKFLTLQDARTQYPQQFAQTEAKSTDTDTWVSIVDTDERVRVSTN